MKRSLLLLLLAVTAASCASVQAKSPAERPNLDVPPPPPRVIEPMPVEPPPPEPVAELPPAAPPRTRPAPTASREPARETTKPEPKPEPVEPPPAATPPTPAPQLRTPTVPDGPAAERQIREILDRALRMLNSIDYRKLTAQQQANYNTAKNFIKEGDEALKKADYLYAKELADKADRFAKELQGR